MLLLCQIAEVTDGDVAVGSVLCTDAVLEKGAAFSEGDPTQTSVVDYANRLGLPVRARAGARYYISPKAATAEIRTCTDWTGAAFVIDDRGCEDRTAPVFTVSTAEQAFPLPLSALARGQTALENPCGRELYVTVQNENHRDYIRLGLNQNNGFPRQDYLLLHTDGTLSSAVSFDFDEVTYAAARPLEKETLTLTGGEFTTLANPLDCTLTPYTATDRNIRITRSNVTVTGLKSSYSGQEFKVKVENNRLTATKVPMFDRHGHKGEMSIDVSLAHLSNIEYNIDVKANNMEVLNTNEEQNSMFYGNVFATGTGSVRGDKAGVKMDFVARSDNNTKFFMPLTDNSDISTADFVTFAKKEQDTTSFLARKKLMFENRQKRLSSGGDAMEITMALDVRPNAEVQLVIDPTVGDIIKATGEGQLNLRINPQADIFEMYGDYTIEKGSYLFTLQNIVNKWFDIESGSTIQWTGEPLDALLNIDAVYKLKASLQPLLEGSLTESNRSTRAVPVECLIHLTDRLTQPTVTFDIVVPSADSEVQNLIASALATPESKSQQFLYLILANSFISESSNSMSPESRVMAAALFPLTLWITPAGPWGPVGPVSPWMPWMP